MKKLNFGCGTHIAEGWENIDFVAFCPKVKLVNLLGGFPYPDNSFDVAYSSHVLEHFTKSDAFDILKEVYRILRTDGIVRIVVPDLEGSCREYLRVLEKPDTDKDKRKQYSWMIVELIDQMVRKQPAGEMGKMLAEIGKNKDQVLIDYVRLRQGSSWFTDGEPLRPFWQRLRGALSWGRINVRLLSFYLHFVSYLLPKHIRKMAFVYAIGDQHLWMYDAYGLKLLLEDVGFCDCKICKFNESSIPDFNRDCLDCTDTGVSYIKNSLYLEARKKS